MITGLAFREDASFVFAFAGSPVGDFVGASDAVRAAVVDIVGFADVVVEVADCVAGSGHASGLIAGDLGAVGDFGSRAKVEAAAAVGLVVRQVDAGVAALGVACDALAGAGLAGLVVTAVIAEQAAVVVVIEDAVALAVEVEARGALGDIAFAVLADCGGDARRGRAVDDFFAASGRRVEDALVIIDVIFGLAFFGDAFAGDACAADPCAHDIRAVAVVFAAVFFGIGFADAVEEVIAFGAFAGDAFLIAADHLDAVFDVFGGADMAASAAVGRIGIPVDAFAVAEAERFVAGVFAFAVGADLSHVALSAFCAAAFGRILDAFAAVEVIAFGAGFGLAAVFIFADAVAGAFGECDAGQQRAVDHPRGAFFGGIGNAFVVDDMIADLACVDDACAVEACRIFGIFDIGAFDAAVAAVFSIFIEIDAEITTEIGALTAYAVAVFAVLVGRADFAVIAFAAAVAAFAVDGDERRDAFGGVADADAGGGIFTAFAGEEVAAAVFADDIVAGEVDAGIGFFVKDLTGGAVYAFRLFRIIVLIGEAVDAFPVFPFPGLGAIDAAEAGYSVIAFAAAAAAATAAAAFLCASPDAEAVFGEIDVVDFRAFDDAFAFEAGGVLKVACRVDAAS